MATYILFGKYSPESLDGISAARTAKATEIIKNNRGKVRSMHVLLGQYDLVMVVEFPGVQEAMKASLALTRLTGINFATSEAIAVEDFDKMVL